jgi:hypothetical protein
MFAPSLSSTAAANTAEKVVDPCCNNGQVKEREVSATTLQIEGISRQVF